jgi:NTE family protein
MPFGSEGVEDGIGLALSGGGFRASLFHLGSLWRLNELGLLPKLKRISSISGGSITAGVLGLAWNQLGFNSHGIADPSAFDANFIQPLKAFCGRTIDAPAIGEGAFLPGRRISDVIIKKYNEHLFSNKTLQDLPDESAAPRFVFGSTNMQTGVSFRFSKPYLGDYRLGLLKNPRVPIALAVAASSAFPPVLSPVVLKAGPFEPVQGADLNGKKEYTEQILLTDGGVYDNLGLETVWNRYKTLLVSDAGAPSEPVEEPETAWHKQVMMALDVATAQSRALRKRALMADYRGNDRTGAYWGIASDIRSYQAQKPLPVNPATALRLSRLRTRLNKFSDEEQCSLINFGYALTDAAVQSHGKSLTPQLSESKWPYPNCSLS